MEVKLSNTGYASKEEMTTELYPLFCRLCITERIYKSLPSDTECTYGDVASFVDCVNSILYENLNTETGKVILLNEIYNLFMRINVELQKNLIYEIVDYLASYYPGKK